MVPQASRGPFEEEMEFSFPARAIAQGRERVVQGDPEVKRFLAAFRAQDFWPAEVSLGLRQVLEQACVSGSVLSKDAMNNSSARKTIAGAARTGRKSEATVSNPR
jgi:hypothetical protein